MKMTKLALVIAALCASGGAIAQSSAPPPVIQASASNPIAISSATTTQVISALSGAKTYITGFDFISAGTGTVQFEYGTGTNCSTVAGTLTGAYPMAANFGISKGGIGPELIVPAGNAVCVVTTTGATAQGSIAYAQY